MRKSLALIFCVSSLLLAACGGDNNSSNSTSSSELSSSSGSSVGSQAVNGSQPNASVGTSTENTDDRGITGSDYFPIIYVLNDEFGIPYPTQQESADQEFSAYSVYSLSQDQDQSAMFDYYIYLDDDEEVISATFGITNDYTNSTIFESRAELFIYCVGLLPYDTAKSDETADALCEAIDTLEEGTPFVLTEGDVTFELYATKDAYGDISSIFLEISKAE